MKIEFTKYTPVVSPLHNERNGLWKGLSIKHAMREAERTSVIEPPVLAFALASQGLSVQIKETRALERRGMRIPEVTEHHRDD